MSDHPFDGHFDSTSTLPRLDLAVESATPRVAPRQPRSDAYDLDDPEVHLLDYVKVLFKRRWTAITPFLLVVMSVTVYNFTATPIYEAKTRLLIETENPNVVSFKAVVDEDQTKQDYYQTQYNILQSRALARR